MYTYTQLCLKNDPYNADRYRTRYHISVTSTEVMGRYISRIITSLKHEI